jgi:predicted ATP-dependent protease
VNQWGEVQAVGGVTHKIEGFFAVCKAQGLTGDQGVLIPESNVRHLMLRQEVLDAVERGLFHVWAVRHVDEGLQILTGVPAGSRRADGSYGEGTVHGRVRQRTLSAAEQLAAYSARRLPDTRPRG